MTNWLGVGDKNTEDTISKEENKENQSKSDDSSKTTDPEATTTKESDGDETKDDNRDLSIEDAKQTLEDVSAKALNTAKEWGSM